MSFKTSSKKAASSKKDMSKKDMSKKDISKKDISKKDISKKDISKKDISKKDISKDTSFDEIAELAEMLKKDISKKDISKEPEKSEGKDTEKKFLCINPNTGKHFTFEELFGKKRGKLTLSDTSVFSKELVTYFESIAKELTTKLPQKCHRLVTSDTDADSFPLLALAVACELTGHFDTKAFILATLTMLCRYGGMLVTGKGVGLYDRTFERGCLYLMDRYGATVKDPHHTDWCGKIFRTPLQNRLGNDFCLCSLCNSAMCYDIRGRSLDELLSQLEDLLQYALELDRPKKSVSGVSNVSTVTLGMDSFGIKPTAFTRSKKST